MQTNKFIETLFNSVILLLMLMAAVSYNGKLFGLKISEIGKKQEVKLYDPPASSGYLTDSNLHLANVKSSKRGIWRLEDSKEKDAGWVIHSSRFSSDVYGYAGPIPMYIYLDKDSVVNHIDVLPNTETPRFLNNVIRNGIVEQWMGKSLKDLNSFQPDAVSGATLSSNAINKSVANSLLGASSLKPEHRLQFDVKSIAALFIIILGVVMSLFLPKKKEYRLIQLTLNTIVLGFWCGKFISLQILMGWISNGVNLGATIVLILMFLLALLIPMFTKQKQYYCNWICPFGSAQELVGKLNKRKVKIPEKLMKVLSYLRIGITGFVFFLLWIGIATDIVDYEPFSAFLFNQADVIVLVIAVLSLITSLFISRPYCRFVCPTGQVLSWMHRMK